MSRQFAAHRVKRRHIMHLQPVGNTDPKERYHAHPGVAKALIRGGMAEEVTEAMLAAEKTWLPMQWTLGAADWGEGAPIIHYNCPNGGCNAKAGSIASTK